MLRNNWIKHIKRKRYYGAKSLGCNGYKHETKTPNFFMPVVQRRKNYSIEKLEKESEEREMWE